MFSPVDVANMHETAAETGSDELTLPRPRVKLWLNGHERFVLADRTAFSCTEQGEGGDAHE
jgi:hypothetical protein